MQSTNEASINIVLFAVKLKASPGGSHGWRAMQEEGNHTVINAHSQHTYRHCFRARERRHFRDSNPKSISPWELSIRGGGSSIHKGTPPPRPPTSSIHYGKYQFGQEISPPRSELSITDGPCSAVCSRPVTVPTAAACSHLTFASNFNNGFYGNKLWCSYLTFAFNDREQNANRR